MALGTSLLQYYEIAEWATIILFHHHQTEDLTDRTDEFKDFKHFSGDLGSIVNFNNAKFERCKDILI